MAVESAKFITADDTIIAAVVDGVTMFVPKSSVDARDGYIPSQVADWIASGNTVQPYVAPTPTAQQIYESALSAGLTVNWTVSTSLSAIYDIDKAMQFNITAEQVSVLTNNVFANSQTTRNWPDKSGSYHLMTIAQFKKFSTAVAQYVDQLASCLVASEQGQTPTWPSSTVTITG